MTLASKSMGLTVGIVVDREDKKEQLGRVRLKLPLEKDRETDWCRVLMPFAGETHGAYCVPEKGDEVVVAYYAGDPKMLFVLGSIYSKKRKPPTTKVDERRFHTKGGTQVLISDVDGEEKVLIETENKQKVLIDEKSKTITIANEHTIELAGEGKKVTVKSAGGNEIVLDDNANSIKVKATTVEVVASSIALKKG